MAASIQDHALIGDSRSAALVSRQGSVDWLCWPRFDSPSLFAAILDDARGGAWRIAPSDAYTCRRRYLEDSNVLVTTFTTSGGEVELLDLMSVYSEEDKARMLVPEHELLRVVRGLRGEVELEVWFAPRPDFARRPARLRDLGRLGLRLEDGAQLYTLRAEVPLTLTKDVAVARFRLSAGESRAFSLTYDAHAPTVLPPLGEHAAETLDRTARYWQAWASRCTYAGRHREAVIRSLLVLELMVYAPSGAIIAAPTTSLPERMGGELNWDYRFCWLRDASLTVRALLDLGYPDEAGAFVSWLLHTTRLTRPRLDVLYDVYGRVPGREEVLAHLDGHGGSRPVRVRNAASTQLQLDAYGEVIDAVAQMCRRSDIRLDRQTQAMLRGLGRYVCEHWREPDQGIWEPRSDPQHHTHSRLLCWTALDRLLELEQAGQLSGLPVATLIGERERIRRDVEEHAWNPQQASYTEVLGGDSVDASLLLLPWYGFLAANDARFLSTLRAVRQRLEVAPGLLYRYEASRAAHEGVFGLCGCWAAEMLARGAGSLADAERELDGLLACANDVGLLGEEIDPASGAPLGNFPQTYTHVGVIGAALAIEARRGLERGQT